MGRLSWLLAVCAAVACLQAGVSNAQAAPNRYALLVGVEDYSHPKLREPAPLKYSVDDVTDLARLLQGNGFEVVLLTDDTGAIDPAFKPTKVNIDARLTALARKCGEHDTLVLAFAGHGLQFTGQKDAYFCPSDARPFKDEAGTLVSITAIYEELERSFAGTKVILVDACRNDPDPGRGRGLDSDSAPAPPKGVAALFSCSAGQRAYEHDDLKHGVFFHHVLEGLRGRAADAKGEVSCVSLYSHLSKHVPETVARLVPGREQFPNLKADLIGRSPLLVRVDSSPQTIEEAVPGKVIENSLGMKFVGIPAGKFLMGNEDTAANLARVYPYYEIELFQSADPWHWVQISRPFYLGQHEVTVGQFRAFVEATGYQTEAETDGVGGFGYDSDVKDTVKAAEYNWRSIGFQQSDRHPVANVSWNDCLAFCQWLSRKEGKIYRLPTEAEWEYACRAGTKTRFWHGDSTEELATIGNTWDASVTAKFRNAANYTKRSDGYAFSAPVGRYKANPFQLYDMHGNVFEWCQDGYDAYPAAAQRDPVGPTDSDHRVIRGGGWSITPGVCRSAFRRWSPSNYRYISVGFRLVYAAPDN